MSISLQAPTRVDIACVDVAHGDVAHVDVPEPAALLPLVLTVDDCDSPGDVVDLLSLAAFVKGRQPWARSARLDRVRANASLLPAGARLLRAAVEDGRETHLAVGEGWTLRAVRWRSRAADVAVTAISDELARAVLDEAIRDVVEAPEPDAEVVEMGFWHRNGNHSRRVVRPISAAAWPDLRANYERAAGDALTRLMAVTEDDVAGRMILMHGPPGTGKTTALRSLAREWRSWCQLDCVLDPERLFADPSYLMEVAVGATGDDDEQRWRLLLLEDCDELIRGEAKHSAGQALSRLLNLTDGLLGQGRNVLVAITTNEDLAHLHPAVVRPGRCLAQIEVGPLPFPQAAQWLGTPAGVGPDGATLAELYALHTGREPVRRACPPHVVGGYL